MQKHSDRDLQIRNVVIRGRRTSLRLENQLWSAIDDICANEGINLHEFCESVEDGRRIRSRTSAIRTAVISYLRHAASQRQAALPYNYAQTLRTEVKARDGRSRKSLLKESLAALRNKK